MIQNFFVSAIYNPITFVLQFEKDMTHSLEDLKSGKLIGLKRLKLACGLTEFPEEILKLSGTLEVLDLTDNKLEHLPDSVSQLRHLKIFFASNNNFAHFPAVLGKLPELSMIGFKANKIERVSENVFPAKLRWLILTDNRIKKLPQSIGSAKLLQKCMLAGNFLETLPEEMSQCKCLELLRISSNKLKELPKWLLQLPKLSWVAFGGNEIRKTLKLQQDSLGSFEWSGFEIEQLLGEGASGVISKGFWREKEREVALKVFKGAVTSDGLPEDEMKASIQVGTHKNLIPILGKIKNHPEGKMGLIMELIDLEYINLGNPPSLKTCTRDVFTNDYRVFSFEGLFKIAKSIASVCAQLHAKGINHGDLYAHNILINPIDDCLLGDFGAASFYETSSSMSKSIQRIEVRAFGCLVEDILGLVKEENKILQKKWKELIDVCMLSNVLSRPSFLEILERLDDFRM